MAERTSIAERNELGRTNHGDAQPTLQYSIAPGKADSMTQKTQWPTEWTYSEYARFPDDGNRYEVLDGEVLVTPAPTPGHQHVGAKLFMALWQYVDRHALGIVLWDVDLLFASGHFLRPDMVFVPKEARSGITDRGVEAIPRLVVEIVSPSSSSIDRVKKPRRYADFGVPEYWVVDPATDSVCVYRLNDGMGAIDEFRDRLVWQPNVAIPALEIRLAEVFSGF